MTVFWEEKPARFFFELSQLLDRPAADIKVILSERVEWSMRSNPPAVFDLEHPDKALSVFEIRLRGRQYRFLIEDLSQGEYKVHSLIDVTK